MLSSLSTIYEIVVFTSSEKSYADSILNYIDKDHVWIHHRLFREDCVEVSKDVFIKDLRVLGRDLKNVVLVDNAPYAFGFQLENGYPIIPFYDCKEDEEIKKLTQYLLQISNADSVLLENRRKFRLNEILDVNVEKFIKYYYSASSDVGSSERSSESFRADTEEDPAVSHKIKSVLSEYQKAMDLLYKTGT